MTEPLKDTLTLAGPIEVELMTAISSTDADFMVKVIDVYPERFEYPQEIRKQLKSNYPNEWIPTNGSRRIVPRTFSGRV